MVRGKYSGARKSCSQKSDIWNEISEYLKACEYVDRDGDLCKTRIHVLTNAYRANIDNKRNSANEKPPCFDKLDKVLSDKSIT